MAIRTLLMCMGDASWSPRSIRFSSLLRAQGHHVSVASYPLSRDMEFDTHFTIDGPPAHRGYLLRKLRSYSYFASFLPPFDALRYRVNSYRHGLRGVETLLQNNSFDLILVQDLALLPAAIKNRRSARVLFDAREYYPGESEENRRFRIFEKPERIRLCARYLPQCDAVITVSNGLADAYEQNFNVSPVVIRSAARYHDCVPQPVASDRIRMVYHGVANLDRGLTILFELMKLLRPEFMLDLYLVSKSPARIAYFQELAQDCERINICHPVAFDEIVPTLNRYDVGFVYFEPRNFNLLHCMPNKLFEYIQARLVVAIGPSPDMAAVVRQHKCGVVANRFELQSLADALNALDPQTIMDIKGHSAKAAKSLCFEREGQKFSRLISRALPLRP